MGIVNLSMCCCMFIALFLEDFLVLLLFKDLLFVGTSAIPTF